MDKEWIMSEVEQLSRFSETSRGVTRLAFSPEDYAAREYVTKLMLENGLTVRTDQVGNIIGRLEGSDHQAAVVATGSHLDTVPEGGKYDGVVGVIGGIAALKILQERGPLTHPLELIVFAGEESSRFGLATIGSRIMVGSIQAKTLKKLRDQNGIGFSELLNQQGTNIEELAQAVRRADEFKAFVELHIEQGSSLEKNNKTIGIVEEIAAPARCKIVVEGVAAHTGNTPMAERHDALVSAAMIIIAINEIAQAQSARGIVGTVGALKVYPGVINVVPGLVEMMVDIRGTNHQSIIECIQEIKDAVSEIAERQNTGVAIEVLSSEHPVRLDKELVKLFTGVCQQQGIRYQHMNSGAGHDSMNMAKITRAGLIAIPCRAGLSHNPNEYASSEDIQAGVTVLAEALYQLAK